MKGLELILNAIEAKNIESLAAIEPETDEDYFQDDWAQIITDTVNIEFSVEVVWQSWFEEQQPFSEVKSVDVTIKEVTLWDELKVELDNSQVKEVEGKLITLVKSKM